jgi:cytoskeletal protein RodZ
MAYEDEGDEEEVEERKVTGSTPRVKVKRSRKGLGDGYLLWLRLRRGKVVVLYNHQFRVTIVPRALSTRDSEQPEEKR